MSTESVLSKRLRAAWQGRISGCQLGKPVEVMSALQGHDAMNDYLASAGALPLRDYVPIIEGAAERGLLLGSCKGQLERSEPDDDINYTVLALQLMERHGSGLTTKDVARAWLRDLPVGWTFTAERAAYKILLARADEYFSIGREPGFDLAECSDNEWNDWIGAQIRADLYGWVCPGQPAQAAELARCDAALSHRDEGVYGAVFVAALGAVIPEAASLDAAVEAALGEIPSGSACADAVRFARDQAGRENGDQEIRNRYAELPPVHTVNNLALVVWALLSHPDDFGAAIGDVVTAGYDTDCNGATVGGLWGLQGKPIPEAWTSVWRGRVIVTLAGVGELALDDLVERTVAVTQTMAAEAT
ncbi:ADP-ribosylglycohydrolase family protein [Myxococcota bacterium]|nr:ADP-ribosylglycohydrolase family protein [Myxococcota bacterium]